jgi:hypothetical protein
VRTDRSSFFPILMVLLGIFLMVGALLWFAFATRQTSGRAAATTIQAITPATGFSSSVTPLASPAIPYPEVKRVSLGDAKAAFDLKSAIFVDVRGEPYYSESHIPGALSMTVDEMSSRMGELDKNAWIITYCT